MNSTKYKVSTFYSSTIEVLEVTKETEHSIWIKGALGHEKKNSTYSRHFDTWDEAHEYLLGKSKNHYDGAVYALDSATKELEKVKGMICPDSVGTNGPHGVGEG